METHNRRSSVSSQSSSMAKWNSTSENTFVAVKKPQLAKKPPAHNLTNQRNSSLNSGRTVLSKTMVPCEGKVSKMKKKSSSSDASILKSILPKAMNVKSSAVNSSKGDIYMKNILVEVKTNVKVVNIDDNITNPQFCATIASDIYKNLRVSETKNRPSTDFMESVQSDINASIRAILIDWLVEVAEEYMLLPETLFLAVNYVDRYLSGNDINRQRLQLLGVACMLIASKYEEICAPGVKEFSYITDNTYSRSCKWNLMC